MDLDDSSQKLNDAKVPQLCGNCQRKINIAWSCTNCKKILCYNCKFLHAKNESTRNHKVVETQNLKIGGEDSTSNKSQDGSSPTNRPPSATKSVADLRIRETCKEHDGLLLHHCNTCSKPLCNECVQNEHKTHDLIKIQQFIKTEKHKLLQEASDVKKTHLVELNAMLENCTAKRKESENGLNKAYDELNEHTEKLIAEVKSVADEVTDDFKTVHVGNESEISKTETEIKEAIGVVNEAISICENSLDASIYNVYQAKEKMAHLNEGMVFPKEPTVHPVDFEKGQISRSLLSKMICTSIVKEEEEEEEEEEEVIEEPVRPESGKPKIPKEEFDRFILCKVGISCLSVGVDHSVTVRDPQTARGIQKVFIRHGTKVDIKEPLEFDKLVTDICCYDLKITLVTFVGTSAIKIVNQVNGKIASFTDLAPLFPVSLWKTSDGSILVSVVESEELETNEGSTRAVYILSSKGRILKKIEYFQGKRTLNRPHRAVENSKGEIVVVDFIDLDDRVVWMKKDGEEICSYSGHVSPKYPRLMAAQGLACDELNNVYISDARNNVIHVVDGAGKFVRFIENDMDRFFSPWALYMDKDTLWIGTTNGRLYRTVIQGIDIK